MKKFIFLLLVVAVVYMATGCTYMHARGGFNLDAGILGGDKYSQTPDGAWVKTTTVVVHHHKKAAPAETAENCGCPE
jgi:hypothetical protein